MMDNDDARSSRADTDVFPVTTDSMVTVPLSDRQSSPSDICHDPTTLDIPETPIEDKVDGDGPIEEEEERVETPKNEDVPRPASEIKERRGSASSAGSRSTRNSHDSISPVESEGVDWEKLDKTEEQEPRNEATDEVGTEETRLHWRELTSREWCSQRRCCSLVWNKRTMPSLRIPKPGWPRQLDLVARPVRRRFNI
jgi:hypothetical protein